MLWTDPKILCEDEGEDKDVSDWVMMSVTASLMNNKLWILYNI